MSSASSSKIPTPSSVNHPPFQKELKEASKSSHHHRIPSSTKSSSYFNKQKSQTPGEAFFDFLKFIGYQPNPKHDRPEHFEYLFRDEKSAKLVKSLMKIGKRDLVLTNDEVSSYETLKKDGLALFGTDLESAVDTRHAVEKRISHANNAKVARIDQLRKLIELRKSEIRDIKNRNEVLNLMIEEKAELNSERQKAAAKIQRESQELDISIEVATKRLADKVQKLSELKANVIAKIVEQPRKTSVADLECWENIISKEDSLMSIVNPVIKDHVGGLIVQAEGYNNEGQQGDAGIRKIIADHADNLERLKHCIIYEKTRRAKLKLKLKWEEVCIDQLIKCHQQYTKTVSCTEDIQMIERLRNQTEDEIRSLEEVFENEYDRFLESVRDNSLQSVSNEIDSLTESKQRSKKTLEQFFVNVYNILEPQKVRFDVLRNLLKADINFHLDLEEMLFDYAQRYEMFKLHSDVQEVGSLNLNANLFTQDGQALNEILCQLEISPTVLKSTSKTLESLLNIYKNLIQLKWDESNQRNAQGDEYLTHVLNRHQQLLQMYGELKHQYISKRCEERRQIEALENAHFEANQALASLQENHSNNVEENIRLKQALLKEMEDILAEK